MRPVELRAGGRTLAGAVAGRASGGPGILFVHGLDSDRRGYAERAEAAAEQVGAVCLTFDLGGHGESTGERAALSIRDHLADVVAAHDRLVDEGADPARIGVAGASYGGYLAVLLTATRTVARLALRAPALYADADLDTPRAARGRPDGPAAASAALDALRRFAGPVLIVESERDEVVPQAVVAAYRAARPDAGHVVIPEAGHQLATPEARAAFLTALLGFFAGL